MEKIKICDRHNKMWNMLAYEQIKQEMGVQFQQVRLLSPHPEFYEAHPASYPIDTRGSVPGAMATTS
jgi:hypothetical protein